MKKASPLSQSQLGIYAECVKHEKEVFYNLPFLFVFDGSLDVDRLCRAVETTIKAHPTFFTRIGVNDEGEPFQSVDTEEIGNFSLAVEPVTDIEAEKQKFIVPYDFIGGRLFHTKVMRDAEHIYWLFDMHHIISDGTSYNIIIYDVEKAYNGGTLAPEEMSMQEFALAEAEMRKTPAFEEGKQWYAQTFDCGDTFTQLMPDLEISEHADADKLRILGTDMDRVDAFCKTNGIKKSTFFTSAFSFLLAKFNNEHESLFTTVFNGRTEPKFQHSVGMTVKTLPVYAKFTDDTTVLDFLKAGEEQMVGCRKHDIYSYTDIMADLNLQTNALFTWHGLLLDYTELMGKPMQAIQLRKHNEGVSFYMMAFYVGKKYHIKAEYSANEYSATLIDQFMESYEAVLEGFLSQALLRDIDITTKSQLSVLESFNKNDVAYDDSQTVVSLFGQQVEKTPDNIAVVYQDKKYTYREVDELSDRIAGYVLGKGLKAEDVVSVLIPRCEWMAIVSLGVLKAGCAYQPLDPTYPAERLNFMMKDANAKLLIADEELRPVVNEYQGSVLFTKDIHQLPTANRQQLEANGPKPEDLFILLYTSGSTGVPKGCQLEHRNLVAFCHWYQRYYSLKPEHKVAAYASYGFDACMMDMYPALTCGAGVHIIPEEIRLDLIALNEYFEQHHITHSFMTTQVCYQFATSIENHSLLHLSAGGEKLATLEPPQGYTFHNGYGPTECTIFTTTYPVTRKMKDIPIGKPVDNLHLYVVDRHGHRMPVGASGELLIAGPQVGRGYLNRPEKTAEVFVQNPYETDAIHARVYRTGDIVRYLPDGNIQFVGRRDGQVKIRGFRIELKEVEAVIREFPGIKDVTVQAFDEEGGNGKFIAAYIVADEPIDIEALNTFIMDEKPPYMVPAVTMQIDRIPLNQNQKVNKKALPKPEKKASEAVVESNVPMNVLEQEIHDIIAKIISTEDFGVTTVLGYAGLTSIMAIKLAIQINKRFGVTLDSKSLAKTGTLQSIENEILDHLLNAPTPSQTDANPDNALPSTPNAQPNNAPLSYAQIGVYVDCMKQPTSTVYNIPSLIRFPNGTDVQLLGKSLETLVKVHPQFNVHFGSEGGDIIQIVDADQPVVIAKSQLSEAELEKYKLAFVKPFNLRQGPLYRMEIVTTERAVYLLADVHHLIFDGGSFDLFLNQLCDLMNGKGIEAEVIGYADFVADEKAAENSPAYIEARNFFNERLGKVEGITEVPSDLTNPLEQGSVSEVFSQLDFSAIEGFCKQHNLSPAHLTLAAVFYSLARFTNNEQVCITTISNGRSDLRIRNTVGMFVNTLALSAQIGEQSVMDFVKETSKNFDETLVHERYPFAQIAADYDLSAEIMFAYQIGVLNQYLVNNQKLEIETLELLLAPKFRIAFYIQEKEGVPGVVIEYDNGRYSESLMQSLAQSVCNTVSAFICHPEAALQQVSLLDDKQTAVLDGFNQTEVPYDDTQTIVLLFRRQVQQTPDNMAVVYHDHQYTYREVDAISERIAAYIASQGLGKEDVVSVLIPRCEWMVIASLGVLKAGCAYQPLDPSYPAERLNFMMKDANAKMLIADEDLRPVVDEYQGTVLLTKDVEKLPDAKPLSVDIQPSTLFILLYTSGSTGTPKGCQLEHGNLVAFCHWYQRHYGLTATDRVAAYASYGFDACMMDLYPALTCGACVHIIGDDIRLNLPDLNNYFNEQGITHSFITTQVGYQFVTNVENHSLRCFAVGGEKLSALDPPTNYKMYNGYGPTECTIFTTNYWVKDYEMDIPIGKPLDNLELYIVDKQFNRLPLGAAGELWVSGPQVSRGYLNRPEKTAETYLKNPFSDDPKHARVYRTGDIVRYLPDGNIQFVGRRDGQVKIRGFRIELKEVEAVIRQFPGIKDVTVQAFDYEKGGKYIAAYIVSDNEVDVKNLNAFIGQQKPPYMIPASTMQIDSIPLNQNQKVNRKALPTPVMQVSDREYQAPANDTERLFCKIFSDILSMDKIGATDNFFDLGGTSLMVTRVILEADKAGYHVAYGDVFANNTPRKLAALVTGNTTVSMEEEDVADFDYADIDKVLENNTLEEFGKGEHLQLGNALLTGATGYLGIHVLKELIDSDAQEIYCIVRDKDLAGAEHRLKTLLFYYFENTYDELFGKRLHIVLGDVTNDLTSLVQAKIDTVFNCAAVVKHFSEGTEIEDVNVGGAQRCVDFCVATGAKLVHISTASTRGLNVNSSMAPGYVFTEQRLYGGQYLGNQYIHSKFLAERVVLQAVAEKGLVAKVVRVGNLSARSTDGEFQINFSTNAFMGRIKVYNMLGCFPYSMYEQEVEFSPINEVARAIILLATTPKSCCVFHAYNNHSQFFGDVLSGLSNVGTNIRLVEDKEYEETLEQAGNDPQKAKMLSSLLAYQDMAHGMKAEFVDIANHYTSQVLYRLGFKWSATTWDYIDRMLNAISGLEFFD
ncbi:MAG: amino acid adenylation domain-containing protein [Bacteroidales bacterium]|nr:amino acid adenylation domain-containing protein [Bacteroidales bacterium]